MASTMHVAKSYLRHTILVIDYRIGYFLGIVVIESDIGAHGVTVKVFSNRTSRTVCAAV